MDTSKTTNVPKAINIQLVQYNTHPVSKKGAETGKATVVETHLLLGEEMASLKAIANH